MPNDDGLTPVGGSDPAGDAIRRRLTHAVEPADPTGAFERVVEKRFARRIRRRVVTVALAIAVVTGTAGGSYALFGAFRHPHVPQPAVGSQTGFTNGQIAFVDGSSSEIWTANADGSGLRQLTHPPTFDLEPVWSPDGSMIAYQGLPYPMGAPFTEIWVMNSDGSAPRSLTGFVDDRSGQPTWSPDGRTVYFVQPASDVTGMSLQSDPGWFLSAVDLADGSVRELFRQPSCGAGWFVGQHPSVAPNGDIAFRSCAGGIRIFSPADASIDAVPGTAGADSGPSWSPDGTTLVFGRGNAIETVRPDGGGFRTVAHVHAGEVLYSPDGTMILYWLWNQTGAPHGEYWLIDADGSHRHRLPLPESAQGASWQPIPPDGVPSPSVSPTPRPTVTSPVGGTPTPVPTPTAAAPTPLCPTSSVTADFDGDGQQDTATVEATTCHPVMGRAVWRLSVAWGSGATGTWELTSCGGPYCSAMGAMPMNDGSNPLILRTGEGVSTVTYELIDLVAIEHGPEEYVISGEGSIEFPPGAVAVFEDMGSVTHQDFFRCQGGPYTGGGDQATIVETNAILSQEGTTYTVVETVLAHGPDPGRPELIVVSRDARVVPLESFDPAKDVNGVPCW